MKSVVLLLSVVIVFSAAAAFGVPAGIVFMLTTLWALAFGWWLRLRVRRTQSTVFEERNVAVNSLDSNATPAAKTFAYSEESSELP